MSVKKRSTSPKDTSAAGSSSASTQMKSKAEPNATTASTAKKLDDHDDDQQPSAARTTNKNGPNNDNKKQDEQQGQQLQQQQKQPKSALETIQLRDFFDVTKPWVLVPNGSAGNHFDWVPKHLRIGPWSIQAIVYLSILLIATIVSGIYLFATNNGQQYTWWGARAQHDSDSAQLQQLPFAELEYPAPYSWECWYNTCACVWMIYVSYLVCSGPLGMKAWGTYTIQSWTLLTFRHGICALASWYPNQYMYKAIAEAIRFPAICSPTITFFVWNCLLVPFIYCFGMKTPKARQGFMEFNFSFRLVQIHMFNIVYCVLNGYYTSPARTLQPLDLYIAAVSVVLYMAWYFLFLDRIGVHLYPVFSPRAKWMVIPAWSSVLGLYWLTYWAWQKILMPEE